MADDLAVLVAVFGLVWFALEAAYQIAGLIFRAVQQRKG